jgi:TonB family protein
MVMPEPISCEHFESLAVLHALGELEAPVRAAVEEHARVCADCATVLHRETALSAILSSEQRAAGAQEPSDRLLARCRSRLSHTLDREAAPSPRQEWAGLLSPREWIASLRLSPKFHPAWSVAALLLVAILSGLAGWQGIGRAALQQWGPTVMTVSAAPPPAVAPPPAAPLVPDAAPQAPSPKRREVNESAENSRVYSAADAGMNNAFSRSWFASSAAGSQPPRLWRHEPPLRMPAASRLAADAAAGDAPPDSGLAGLSRRMESLWWGGLRVDPADQQRRLLQALPPEYPEVARRAGIEGQVTLLLRIGGDGAVQDAQLLSGEPVLGRAAAEAVEQWRYRPVRVGGQPVNVLTSVTLAFELR